MFYTLHIYARNFENSAWPITVVFKYNFFSVLWQALMLFIAQNFSAPAAGLKFDLQVQPFWRLLRAYNTVALG